MSAETSERETKINEAVCKIIRDWLSVQKWRSAAFYLYDRFGTDEQGAIEALTRAYAWMNERGYFGSADPKYFLQIALDVLGKVYEQMKENDPETMGYYSLYSKERRDQLSTQYWEKWIKEND